MFPGHCSRGCSSGRCGMGTASCRWSVPGDSRAPQAQPAVHWVARNGHRSHQVWGLHGAQPSSCSLTPGGSGVSLRSPPSWLPGHQGNRRGGRTGNSLVPRLRPSRVLGAPHCGGAFSFPSPTFWVPRGCSSQSSSTCCLYKARHVHVHLVVGLCAHCALLGWALVIEHSQKPSPLEGSQKPILASACCQNPITILHWTVGGRYLVE